MVENSNYDINDYNQYLLVTSKPSGYNNGNKYFKKRVLWSSNQIPKFNMKDRGRGDQNLLVNIPQFINMYGPYKSINETQYRDIFVKFSLDKGSDEWMTAADNFIRDCKNEFNSE